MAEDLENYRKLIVNQLNGVFISGIETGFFDLVQKLCIDLTYLIHFGFLPNKEDYKGAYYFINAVKMYSLNDTFVKKQINNLPGFYRRTMNYIKKNKNSGTMVARWLENKSLSHENIFMEFIHNILGMAINWTNLTYGLILNHSKGVIGKLPSEKSIKMAYLYECIRFILPVRFTGSHVKNNKMFNLPEDSSNMLIHDFKIYTHNEKYFGDNVDKFVPERMMNVETVKSGCPFSKSKSKSKSKSNKFYESPKGAKVVCGMELLEKDGYMGFGEGYRRCPGEHLSMIYLEELWKKMDSLNYHVYLKNNESKLEKYIWGEIDRNLIIKL